MSVAYDRSKVKAWRGVIPFRAMKRHALMNAKGNATHRLCLVIGFVALVPSRLLTAQEGHPFTGTWSGEVGPRHVTLALAWDGKTVTGTINPGPDAARITAARVDPAVWSIHLEADGHTHIVVDGGLTNIGSAARTLTGTWTDGTVATPVALTRVASQSASSNSGDVPGSPVYDRTRRVTLRGTVTNVEWINPRVRFAVDVRGPKATTHWRLEFSDSPVALERNGWNARSLKTGDSVIVRAISAVGLEHHALAEAVVLANGRAPLFTLAVRTQSPPPGAKGYWRADVPAPDTANLKAGEAVAMPWAKAVRDHRLRTGLRDDPLARCVPPGGPRQFLGPQGFQFVEQRDVGRILVLLGDGNRNWRIVYTDGRPQGQPADVVSSYYGSSVGRWEKDTLVVDSVGYNEKFWFMDGGLPHTEALHLTERFTRTDLRTLQYDVTIDDPRTYTRPWTAKWAMRWVADQEIQEFFCEEQTS